MKQKVAVAFATDHKYRYFTGVALYSLMAHSSPETQYEILILADSLSAADGAIFTRLIAGRENFSLRIVEMHEKVAELWRAFFYTESYPVTVCYRLFLHELLPQYDRVLYLDSDIIVQADVRELFETDLCGAPIGAVKDHVATYFPCSTRQLEHFFYFRNILKIKRPEKYFNSGILVMDLGILRKLDFSQRVRREIGSGMPFKFPDQDILNLIFDGDICYLEKTWNHMTSPGDRTEGEKILHISGEQPWLSFTKPHFKLWWSVAEQTFFSEDLKNELRFSPDRIRYLEDIERAYDGVIRSTCWRMTAGVRLIPNTVKWAKNLFSGIIRGKG